MNDASKPESTEASRLNFPIQQEEEEYQVATRERLLHKNFYSSLTPSNARFLDIASEKVWNMKPDEGTTETTEENDDETDHKKTTKLKLKMFPKCRI